MVPRLDRHPDIPAHSARVLNFIDPLNSSTPWGIEAVHLETYSELGETVPSTHWTYAFHNCILKSYFPIHGNSSLNELIVSYNRILAFCGRWEIYDADSLDFRRLAAKSCTLVGWSIFLLPSFFSHRPKSDDSAVPWTPKQIPCLWWSEHRRSTPSFWSETSAVDTTHLTWHRREREKKVNPALTQIMKLKINLIQKVNSYQNSQPL